MLRIAIQGKGRLYEDTMALLQEANVKIDAGKRILLVPAKNFPLEILFLRDDDIPQSVASGVADAGIVGENEYVEREEAADIAQRLGFSRCRLSLAIPKDEDYTGVEWFQGKKIATSYPNILRNFLKKNNVKAEIHVITGSVEIAPGIGLADGIFDIVSSGSTLVTNRLKEVEVVMQSEALLIVNPDIDAEKRAILEELMFRFNAIREAEGKKYIMLNIQNDKIQDVCALLPGMESPTVTPLAESGWSSVHSVVEEKRFWEIIAQLKAIGAKGILVLPIEKMVL
ncbi:MAG: ATP phosphoribosyltransferase [Bacteroidales bacterium]|nr:ATP phosphoribosyltransferase [Bacteroidales bacterium]